MQLSHAIPGKRCCTEDVSPEEEGSLGCPSLAAECCCTSEFEEQVVRKLWLVSNLALVLMKCFDQVVLPYSSFTVRWSRGERAYFDPNLRHVLNTFRLLSIYCNLWMDFFIHCVCELNKPGLGSSEIGHGLVAYCPLGFSQECDSTFYVAMYW